MVKEPFCGVSKNPFQSPNKFTQGRLMKIKWLIDDVTAVRSPGIAEEAILGLILAGRCFGQFRSYLWSGSYFVI